MRRTPLYSNSSRLRSERAPMPAVERPGASVRPRAGAREGEGEGEGERGSAVSPPWWVVLERWRTRHSRAALAGALALLVASLVAVYVQAPPAPPALTQHDVDMAVANALDSHIPLSPAVKAWQAIRPSVVRVVARGADAADTESDPEDSAEGNIGTGVVVLENGTILTNLHVVSGAEHVSVEFADGKLSEAVIVGLEPRQDLAVLRARTVPDDLKPATLRSTQDLAVGDHVVAVGYPFGIGPSVTSGVISGLRREFRSSEGKRLLTDLIQFDAAANPGNSGGPLVTAQGEVIGIVTAIMNPTEQRVFVGVGFAVPIETAASAVGTSPF